MSVFKESHKKEEIFTINQIRPVIVSEGRVLLFHQVQLNFPKETFWELPRIAIVGANKPTRKELQAEMLVQIGLNPHIVKTIAKNEEILSNRRAGNTRYSWITVLCSLQDSNPKIILDWMRYQNFDWVAFDDLKNYPLEEWTKTVLFEKIKLKSKRSGGFKK